MREAKPVRRRRKAVRIPGLEAEIRGLATILKRKFPLDRRQNPLGLRDEAVRLLRRALTRRELRPGGRATESISRAERMWRNQRSEARRGLRKKVNWFTIAKACIPGVCERTEPEQQGLVKRLRNAVFNRNRRAARRAAEKVRKRSLALAGPKTG